jgi:hypothetical protein
MNPFHERLARVGLAAADQYGFALAGGYAMQANGFLDRPSADVDLFTAWNRSGEFDTAVEAIIDAYKTDGLDVVVDRRYDTFARLVVSDRHDSSKVELAVDFRENSPIKMAIGPVLHPDDAVANKMCALYGRAFARDFVDVHAILISRRYSTEQMLSLAANADHGFDRRLFADALGRAAVLDDDDFAAYGVHGHDLNELRTRFTQWREDLLAT